MIYSYGFYILRMRFPRLIENIHSNCANAMVLFLYYYFKTEKCNIFCDAYKEIPRYNMND